MTRTKTILRGGAAVVLWLVTIALAIMDVYYLRELFFGVYARLWQDAAPALFWGNLVLLIGAIGAVGFIVWSSEYHRRNFGGHQSWDLFAWSLVIELAIPFIAIILLGGAP